MSIYPQYRSKKFLIIILILIILGLSFFGRQNKNIYTSDKNITSEGNCKSLKNHNQKIQCWEKLLHDEFKNNGLKSAFALLEKLHTNNQNFSGSCHAFTHSLGMEAYRLFKDNKDFNVPKTVSFCNYGFYHGFMEALLTQGENIEEARKFCDYIDKQLGVETPDAQGHCYHGIGHGNAGIHDKRFWGNAPEIISQSLKLCERVAETWDQLYRCASGVYNAISDFHAFSEFGFSMDMIDPKHPFRLCMEQSEKFRAPCYGNFKSILVKVTNSDFKKIASLVEKIPDKKDAATTIWYFAGYNMLDKLHLKNNTYELTTCRLLKPFLHLPCVKGIASGFLFGGTPEKEYEGALNFCNSNQLSKDERKSCFEEVYRLLPSLYSLDNVKKICSGGITPTEWINECLRLSLTEGK